MTPLLHIHALALVRFKGMFAEFVGRTVARRAGIARLLRAPHATSRGPARHAAATQAPALTRPPPASSPAWVPPPPRCASTGKVGKGGDVVESDPDSLLCDAWVTEGLPSEGEERNVDSDVDANISGLLMLLYNAEGHGQVLELVDELMDAGALARPLALYGNFDIIVVPILTYLSLSVRSHARRGTSSTFTWHTCLLDADWMRESEQWRGWAAAAAAVERLSALPTGKK